MLSSFFGALRRLSVLPLGERLPESAGRENEELALFPVAGLAVGAVPALCLVLCGLLGISSPLPEALAVAALAAVTGLRHLGELGRTGEAVFSGKPALGALEVMREKRVGAAGTALVVLVLLGKYSALVALRAEMTGSTLGLVLAVLLMTCIARWCALVLASYSEYARPEGGADESLIASAGRREVWWALMVTVVSVLALGLLALGTPLGFMRGVLALAGCSLLAWFASIYFSGRFGGVTGECLGALVEITEVLALVLMCILPAASPPARPAPGPANGAKVVQIQPPKYGPAASPKSGDASPKNEPADPAPRPVESKP